MPLPSAAQEQRERLLANEANPTPPVEPPTPPINNDNQQPPSDTTKVTISKTEFNELQAAKDSKIAAERRAEAAQADLDALKSRLTELEQAAKGSGKGEVPPAPARPASLTVDTTQIELTDKEKADFEEDTIAMMEKVATNVFRKLMPGLVAQIEAKLGDVEEVARGAVTSVGRVASNGFTDKVRKQVAEFSDFDTLVAHPHWQAFLSSIEELSGMAYGELIQSNVAKQKEENMRAVVKIFRTFFDKYVKDTPTSDGYAGALPSGATVVDVQSNPNAPKTLKYSDRKKLHDDYIARRIKYEEYEQKKIEFDVADREGRIDYNS